MPNESSPKPPMTTTNKILIAGIGVVVIAIAIVGYLLLNKPAEPVADSGERRSIVITESNIDQAQPEIPGSFTTDMNALWTFPDGKSASKDAIVGNSKFNSNSIYFDVYLDDTQQLVYSSPEMPVGARLNEMILDVPLKKGTYSATCDYSVLGEDKDVIGTASFAITLVIEN